MRHFDYNVAGAYAYEQVMQTIRTLGLGMSAVEEQYRRTVFNVVARNQDDHVKNIAFLMDRRGVWRLSPAYDVAYAYNPVGTSMREHQMSVAGKRDGFECADLERFAESSGLRTGASGLWMKWFPQSHLGRSSRRKRVWTSRLSGRSDKPTAFGCTDGRGRYQRRRGVVLPLAQVS